MDTIKPADSLLLNRLNSAKQVKPASKDPEKAATQFEGLLLQEMFKSMWQTMSGSKSLLGSQEEETYRDMLNEAIATSAAEGKGIGIKDVILRDMEKLEHRTEEGVPEDSVTQGTENAGLIGMTGIAAAKTGGQ